MKIRSLLAVAALAAAAATAVAPSAAMAWECPRNITNPYYVTLPNGKVVRVCTPDLNCETCFGISL